MWNSKRKLIIKVAKKNRANNVRFWLIYNARSTESFFLKFRLVQDYMFTLLLTFLK